MSPADDYRQRAADCRRQADQAASEDVRKTLRKIAEQYLALAANEERSRGISAAARLRDDRQGT
jgi:hypothetical protein